MEIFRHCLITTCVILFLSLYTHVTNAFILLAPVGSKFGNKNNFTVLDINDDRNFDFINNNKIVTSFSDHYNEDDTLRSIYISDYEIISLTHDTETPNNQATHHHNHLLKLYESISNHHNSDQTPYFYNVANKNGRQNIHSSGKFGEKSSTENRNPSRQNEEKGTMEEWTYTKTADSAGRFPMSFEREEIIKMPQPLQPPDQSHPTGIVQGHRSRVKRRARPSVMIRVPPSSRYLRSGGIQTYIRSSSASTQSRVEAQVGVLVVADHSVYMQYMTGSGNNHRVAVARIRRYYGMVFAMMNERFSTIKDPYLSIKVTISGILIAERRSDSPWSEDIANGSTKRLHGRASVDTNKALKGFSTWLNGRAGLPEFDHAMVFTAYRLTDSYGVGLGGMAYLEAVCDTKSGNAVSIVGDKGDFQSVRVATHELAHSLGAIHDGERGAEACPSKDAYIMSSMTSYNQKAPLQNAFYFSRCSIKDMTRHLQKSRSSCVRNKPPVYYNYDLERFPPGRIYSPDTQCKLIFGSKSGFCGKRKSLASVICGQLWCRDPNTDNECRTNSFLTALPGTSCGNTGICSLGECVPDKMIQNNNNNNNNNNKDNNANSNSKLRVTSRIAVSNNQRTSSRINTAKTGTTIIRDRTIHGGRRPTSRIGTISSDRTIRGDSVINRGRSISSSSSNGQRDNSMDIGRTGNRDSTHNNVDTTFYNRDKILGRVNNINKGTSIRRDSRLNSDSTIDRNSQIKSDSSSSSIHRDTRLNRDNIINSGSTTSRDSSSRGSNIRRDSRLDRERIINNDRGNTRGSSIDTRNNRDSAIYRDTRINRDRAINRNTRINSDRTINKDNTVNSDRTLDRGINIHRDSGINRDNSRTIDRNSILNRRNSTVNRDNTANGDSTIYRDSRINRHRSTVTSRGRTKNRDSPIHRNRRINQISSNNSQIDKSSIRNVRTRDRNNTIPKFSRSSYRVRKPRRRRHRSRPRGRSGSRRGGRKQRRRRKNRGRKKKRCREDKNMSYCQGLIELNPDGCRRRAIRQYCCATCRKLRKSQKKSQTRT